MTIKLESRFILDVQDNKIPKEIYETCKKIAKIYELGNDTYFYLDEDLVYVWNNKEKINEEFYTKDFIDNTKLVYDFLKENGYDAENVLIKYWW